MEEYKEKRAALKDGRREWGWKRFAIKNEGKGEWKRCGRERGMKKKG